MQICFASGEQCVLSRYTLVWCNFETQAHLLQQILQYPHLMFGALKTNRSSQFGVSFFTLSVSEANTHPVENNRRYKRHPRHEGIRHLSVLGQEFLPPAGVGARLYRLQVHGYTLGACIHYFYRIDVILDHAGHELQLHRWVLNDVDGASVYDVRLTLDRSVLAHELVPVVRPHRLYWKSKGITLEAACRSGSTHSDPIVSIDGFSLVYI